MGRRPRERPSLHIYLASLAGKRVVVELHDDTLLRGILVAADETLGLQLEDASLARPAAAPHAPPREVAYAYIRGSRVRAVHVPPNLTPAEAVAQADKRAARERREASNQAGATIRTGPKGEDALS